METAIPTIRGPWSPDAACRSYPTEWWYPVDEADPDETRETPKRYEDTGAKRICGRCPIQVDCLAYALEHRECCGMWGGATRSDRERLLKMERKAAREAAKVARVEFEEVEPGVFELR